MVLLSITTFQLAAAKLSVTGAKSDADSLNALLNRCSQETAAFKDLLQRVKDSPKAIELNAVSGSAADGVMVDEYMGKGKAKLNMDHILALPCPEFDKVTGTWKFPVGVPTWAFTCCESLAHILGEQLKAVTSNVPGFEGYHNVGLTEQNLVRKEMKQKPPTKQMYLRKGNKIEIDCNPHKVILESKDGKLVITYKTL